MLVLCNNDVLLRTNAIACFLLNRLLVRDGEGAPAFCVEVERDHASEGPLLEELGRLLGEVRACTRCCPLHAPGCPRNTFMRSSHPFVNLHTL